MLIGIDLPSGISQGSVPPGWETQEGSLAVSEIRYELHECKHFAWLGYERPDVRFVLELHDRYLKPPACSTHAIRNHFLIERIWIDDADLRASFTNWLDVPIESLEWSHSNVVGPYVQTSWSADHATSPSSVVWLDYGETDAPFAALQQYAAPTTTGGILMFNTTGDFRPYGPNVPMVVASFAAPTLAAEIGVGQHVTRGGPQLVPMMSWEMSLYADYKCNEQIV